MLMFQDAKEVSKNCGTMRDAKRIEPRYVGRIADFICSVIAEEDAVEVMSDM